VSDENRKCLPFARTWAHPRFCGGVHLVFCMRFCFVCLRSALWAISWVFHSDLSLHFVLTFVVMCPIVDRNCITFTCHERYLKSYSSNRVGKSSSGSDRQMRSVMYKKSVCLLWLNGSFSYNDDLILAGFVLLIFTTGMTGGRRFNQENLIYSQL